MTLFPPNRSPVKREGAETYLLLMLYSFAASVILTRLYLGLTGFPQIGSGELHIAHVLWGGLLLFAGLILPLVFANRWALSLGALVGGVGVGLFIDEVGKFITQSNDYFFPAAAPIIYAFFLLTVLLYLQVRRPRTTHSRPYLYHALELMTEIIDRNLDPLEQETLKERLEYVAHSDLPNHAKLARALLDYLAEEDLQAVSVPPGPFYRLRRRLDDFASRVLGQRRLRTLLLIGLGMAVLASMTQWIPIVLTFAVPGFLDGLIESLLVSEQFVRSQLSATWFFVLVTLDAIIGIILLYALFLFIRRRDTAACRWASFGLMVALTTANLLVFYFSQFAAVATTLAQFVLLLGLLRYQRYILRLSPDRSSGYRLRVTDRLL
jgi:hypothetical protein